MKSEPKIHSHNELCRKNCGDGMVLVDDRTILQQMADEQD